MDQKLDFTLVKAINKKNKENERAPEFIPPPKILLSFDY